MTLGPFAQGGPASPITPTSLTLTGVGAFIVFRVVQRVARMMEDEEQRNKEVMAELQTEREERKAEVAELRGVVDAERANSADLRAKWLVCEAERKAQQGQLDRLSSRLSVLEQRGDASPPGPPPSG